MNSKARITRVNISIHDTRAEVYVLIEADGAMSGISGWHYKSFPRLSTVELAEASYDAARWPLVEEIEATQ